MELWDAYHADGSLAGAELIRGEPIPEGLYHLVCEILVRHADGDYLLMRRDFAKPAYGGFYEATAGGSALRGEDPIACAVRELYEETGISAESLEEIGAFVSRDTIYHSYLCVTGCGKASIRLQAGETIAYKWLGEREFIDFINSGEMIDTQKLRYADYFRKIGYLRD